MPVSVKTIEIDRGEKRLIAEIKKLAGAFVTIGAQADSGRHGAAKIDMAKLLATHEFGSEEAGIPERSVIRSTMNEKESEHFALALKLINGIIDGVLTASKLMSAMGQKIKSNIQAKFGSSSLEPLKASTIARRRKKSDKPLIDSGQLRAIIRFITSLGGKG